jgi:hypothetical protein
VAWLQRLVWEQKIGWQVEFFSGGEVDAMFVNS